MENLDNIRPRMLNDYYHAAESQEFSDFIKNNINKYSTEEINHVLIYFEGYTAWTFLDFLKNELRIRLISLWKIT